MPIQSLACPGCGGQASEYSSGKWQCLDCGMRFTYEPAVHSVVHQHGDTYMCGLCGGQFSVLAYPMHVCPVCGRSVCPECWSACGAMCRYCRHVSGERHIRNVVLAVVGGAVLLFVLAMSCIQR